MSPGPVARRRRVRAGIDALGHGVKAPCGVGPSEPTPSLELCHAHA